MSRIRIVWIAAILGPVVCEATHTHTHFEACSNTQYPSRSSSLCLSTVFVRKITSACCLPILSIQYGTHIEFVNCAHFVCVCVFENRIHKVSQIHPVFFGFDFGVNPPSYRARNFPTVVRVLESDYPVSQFAESNHNEVICLHSSGFADPPPISSRV